MRISEVLRQMITEPIDTYLKQRLEQQLRFLDANPELDAIIGWDRVLAAKVASHKPKDDEAFRLFTDDESN